MAGKITPTAGVIALVDDGRLAKLVKIDRHTVAKQRTKGPVKLVILLVCLLSETVSNS